MMLFRGELHAGAEILEKWWQTREFSFFPYFSMTGDRWRPFIIHPSANNNKQKETGQAFTILRFFDPCERCLLFFFDMRMMNDTLSRAMATQVNDDDDDVTTKYGAANKK